jgi:hypothetical protein
MQTLLTAGYPAHGRRKRESLRFDRMPGNGFRSIGGPTAAGYYRSVCYE